MNTTSHIEWIFDKKGINASYDEACKEVRRLASSAKELWESPFFVMHELDNGKKKLWPCTMEYISRTYDMVVCRPEIPDFFYCDPDDGKLYPVTLGEQQRRSLTEYDYGDPAWIFANADLIANNKIVGYVQYTDH